MSFIRTSIKGCASIYATYSTQTRSGFYINTDGSYHDIENVYVGSFMTNCDFAHASMNGSGVYTFTIVKAGYYLTDINTSSSSVDSYSSLKYLNATSYTTYAPKCLVYFGDDPRT